MKSIVLFFSLLISIPVIAQECNDDYSSDTSRFVDNADGTISDAKTGLMWQKCVYGQTWQDGACQGRGLVHQDLSQALNNAERNTLKSFFDWRVPNIKELYTLVNTECRPSYYSDFGPLYENSFTYSSSTPVIGGTINSPISVYIYDGSIRTNLGVGLIRLVRYDN